jgi:hypothetical protein
LPLPKTWMAGSPREDALRPAMTMIVCDPLAPSPAADFSS